MEPKEQKKLPPGMLFRELSSMTLSVLRPWKKISIWISGYMDKFGFHFKPSVHHLFVTVRCRSRKSRRRKKKTSSMRRIWAPWWRIVSSERGTCRRIWWMASNCPRRKRSPHPVRNDDVIATQIRDRRKQLENLEFGSALYTREDECIESSWKWTFLLLFRML